MQTTSTTFGLVLPAFLVLCVTPVHAVETWEIVVISVSGAAVGLLLVCLLFMLCRPKSKKEGDATAAPSPAAADEESDQGGIVSTVTGGARVAIDAVGTRAGSLADRALGSMESAVGVGQNVQQQTQQQTQQAQQEAQRIQATTGTVFSTHVARGAALRDPSRRR